MSEHTKEPWRVAEDVFDNDGASESVIRALDDRAAVAVTLDFGPNNPGMREANARRIVACVNACAGIKTWYLEQLVSEGSSINTEMLNRIKLRCDLLDALNRAEHKLAAYVGVCNGDKELIDAVLPKVRAAIAMAKGGAA